MGGHHIAVGGDLQELRLPLLIGALRRHLPGQVCVTLAQNHDGVAGDGHGVELVPPVQRLRVGLVVQGRQSRLDVLLVVQVALLIELHGPHGVARTPLLHELGEDSGGVGLLPLPGHAPQDALPHGPAGPVGDDGLLLGLEVRLRDGEIDHLPVVHVVHVLQSVAAQLREGGRGLGGGPLLAHDQLAVSDVKGLVREDVLEGQRPQLRHGDFALIHLIGLCLQHRPLHVDMGLRLRALPAQALDTLVHAPLLTFRHVFSLLFQYL